MGRVCTFGVSSILKINPFQALYGRKCKMPMSWDNLVNRVVLGPKMIKKMEEHMVKIKQNLKVA
jgi:hypothetical protein